MRLRFSKVLGHLAAQLLFAMVATAAYGQTSPPGFIKSFAPGYITSGGTSTLTFTIDNTANAFAATALDFTDTLPAAVVVATPPSSVTTCTGGTLTAVAGSGVISYTGGTVAAGASCTVTVDVTSSTPGSHLNTSGDLTSSAGNSGPASDTLTVALPVPTLGLWWMLILGGSILLVALRQLVIRGQGLVERAET